MAPIYRAEHECPANGSGAWRFAHERTDVASADCPACGASCTVQVEQAHVWPACPCGFKHPCPDCGALTQSTEPKYHAARCVRRGAKGAAS